MYIFVALMIIDFEKFKDGREAATIGRDLQFVRNTQLENLLSILKDLNKRAEFSHLHTRGNEDDRSLATSLLHYNKHEFASRSNVISFPIYRKGDYFPPKIF